MLRHWLVLGLFSMELFVRGSGFETQCFRLQDKHCPNSRITFRLFNSDLPNGLLIEPETLHGLDFKSDNPLQMIIHGFKGSYLTTPNIELIPQFLKIPNITIISVDFASLVPDPCYTEAVHNAHIVGRCIGYFVSSVLIDHVTVPEQLHLIGFGIGAHIAAFASNYLAPLQLKVAHITALDPAKPLYLTPDLSERLDPTDADFVDVIHSDILIHGLMQSVGHVDFYPNKGAVQPGCGPIDDIDTHNCYHGRSAQLYAESINSEAVFWAFRCRDLYAFIMKECYPSNNVEQLGYYVRQTARGNFFLMTSDSPPFAKGRDFSNLDRTLYGKTYLGDELLTMLKELGPSMRTLASTIGR